MENSNKLPLVLRWWGLLVGVATFFWLPNEDTGLVWLLALSTAWCVWLGGWLRFRLDKFSQPAWGRVLIAGLGGASVFPVALFLVIFKAGLHQHGFLDFTNSQLRRVLELTPFWGACGVLLGLALEMVRKTRNA